MARATRRQALCLLAALALAHCGAARGPSATPPPAGPCRSEWQLVMCGDITDLRRLTACCAEHAPPPPAAAALLASQAAKVRADAAREVERPDLAVSASAEGAPSGGAGSGSGLAWRFGECTKARKAQVPAFKRGPGGETQVRGWWVHPQPLLLVCCRRHPLPPTACSRPSAGA